MIESISLLIFGTLMIIFFILFVGAKTTNEKVVDDYNRIRSQVNNLDQDCRNISNERDVAKAEVKRITNKLIEIQNKSTLIEKDSKERMEDFKKHPLIACMTDVQISVLAEMLAIRLEDILGKEKEYIN